MHESVENSLWEMRLAMLDGVGPRTRFNLVDRFGSAQEVFTASQHELRMVTGVGPKVVQQIQSPPAWQEVEKLLDECTSLGIEVVPLADERYPPSLVNLPDPPGVLYQQGALQASDRQAIAIVGTRHATPYGLAQAKHFAYALSRAGYTIVSGLARGIDAAAHRGALDAGGRTIAVLGSGLACIYPPEHLDLAKEIAEKGALLSEQPPHSPPTRFSFPQRNRIVTGLSIGVVVVEAAERSGALISGRLAAEQGREVFAIPGRIDSRMSKGCHQLIREGAALIESVEHVLEQLESLGRDDLVPPSRVRGANAKQRSLPSDSSSDSAAAPPKLAPIPADLSAEERKIVELLSAEPMLIDQVTVRSKLPISRVLSTLSVLEMKRLISRVGGNQVMRR
nr:DNA-processing protein DprA [Pirellula staleyi]